MPRTGLPILAAALVLAGCDTQHDPVGGPSFGAGAVVVGHANGDGTFNIGAPGADIAFELNAVSRADGSASGSVYYVTDLTEFGIGTIEMRFDVTCLSRDPELGRAWIGGVVTFNNSTNATFATDPRRQVDRDVWFRIEDNGTGGSGTLDLSTQLGFEGSAGIITSAEYCATRPWPAAPAHPVTTGNVSLR
jgi:hypothetical protein